MLFYFVANAGKIPFEQMQSGIASGAELLRSVSAWPPFISAKLTSGCRVSIERGVRGIRELRSE